MRFLKWTAVVLLLLTLIYLSGPHPSTPVYRTELPQLPSSTGELGDYLKNKETLHRVKPGNEATIIWSDSSRQMTDYSVVYLHGFSASHEEGMPVHTNFAKKFGCNLFLARLADHGIDTTEPLLNYSAERSWESAKEAYATGLKLGKKVILMATSTGATLALKLAAEYDDIAALILMSPNIAINDRNAWLLNDPWGLQIARMVKGKYNTAKDTTARYARYWNNRYRMEATVQLQELLESTMNRKTFSRVKEPVLLLYYYRDEQHQDKVVKVPAMKKMYSQLGTSLNEKREVNVPGAGDHVIGSYIKSSDTESVEKACEKFAMEVLGMKTRQEK